MERRARPQAGGAASIAREDACQRQGSGLPPFSDTARDLGHELRQSGVALLEVATGATADAYALACRFSPRSNGTNIAKADEIRALIRTDVLSERSTLAAWRRQSGAQLMPLYEARRAFVLGSRVVHADETPIALLGTA